MPAAKKISKKLTTHDDVRIDNYFWMKKRDSKPVLDYLKAENTNTKKALKPTEGLQKKLIKEMRSRIKEDEMSAPTPRPPYFYYTRYVKGAEYAVFARKKDSMKAKEEVLIDGNKLGKGKKYFAVGAFEESPNQRWIGYGTDTVGRRFYDLYFKDTETGKILKDVIKQTTGNFVWANDNKTIYYVMQDAKTLRANQLFRYELGSKKKPTLIFDEKDEEYHIGIEKGRSDRWLFLHIGKRDSSEVRYLDLNNAKAEWQIFYPRQPDFEYQLEDGGEEFFIITNWKAPNYRILKSGVKPTLKEDWVEVIPHDDKVFLENIDVYKNFFALEERSNGLTQISVVNRTKEKGRELKFPDPTYTVELMGLPTYDSAVFRFSYNSLVRPTTVYEENFETAKREIIKTKEVPGYDADKYESLRLWAKAKDGTKIPISVLLKKGTKLDGKNPLLMDGYGSYGLSNDPEFYRNVISMIDRGFIYAIAHIRGGGEMGRYWYEEGRLKKKINTFTDFIAAGEFLIEEKYTSTDHLYAWGGSAGGLLMGAVINMRPDLFNGVIAAVPFVDVVTTMLDDSVPLTTAEYREWGDPRQKDDYLYIKSYSPYDNVKAQKYPNLLVTTGYHDSQVQYWEPMKWVAKMRELKTKDDQLLLLYTDFGAGHSGASGRFQALNDTAREYAFYLMLEGIKK
jgi:oligopeptidase B